MLRKGFTLMEILIVITILGIMATLALPKFVGQIASVESAEAMFMFGAIKRAAVQCFQNTQDYVSCDSAAELGVFPADGSRFTYTTAGGTPTELTIWAARTSVAADWVSMSLDSGGRTTFAASAGGPFVGIVGRIGSTTATVAPGVTAY